MRLLGVAVLLLVLAGAATVHPGDPVTPTQRVAHPAPPAAPPTPPTEPRPRAPDEVAAALRILHGWDARRSAAWTADDPDALRRLYLPGAPAAAADVALLRRWDAAGLAVRRIRIQVFAARVLDRDEAALRLWILDRVAGGAVSDGRSVRRLRASPPAARVVELRRTGGRWRMASVTAPARAPDPTR